jgi:hypothetical protein
MTDNYMYERDVDKAVKAIKIPDDDSFGQDYIDDPKLEKLARVLIENCEELCAGARDELAIKFLWKRTGGKSSGMATLGKCARLSGLVKFFGEVDFVIWLAADHCRDRDGINLAALMFHELMHVDQDDKGQPAIRAHEFEGFSAEIDRFGLWRESMRPIAAAFQKSLFPEEQNEGSNRGASKRARVRKSGDSLSSAPAAG